MPDAAQRPDSAKAETTGPIMRADKPNREQNMMITHFQDNTCTSKLFFWA